MKKIEIYEKDVLLMSASYGQEFSITQNNLYHSAKKK